MVVLCSRCLLGVCDSTTLLLLINLFTAYCDIRSLIIGSSDVDPLPHYDTAALENASQLECIRRSWTATSELVKQISTREIDWDNLWRVDDIDEEEEERMDRLRKFLSKEYPIRSHTLLEPWMYILSLYPDDPIHIMYTFRKLLNRTVQERETIGPAYTYRILRSRWKRLTRIQKCSCDSNGVVYWMFRDLRVQDNWAMIFAQKIAVKFKVPLHVVYYARSKFLDYNELHWFFVIKSLQEIADELSKLNITFHLFYGDGEIELPHFIKQFKIGTIVLDFNPLREPVKWVKILVSNMNETVPIYQVDAHNIIPIWTQPGFADPSSSQTIATFILRLPYYLSLYPNVVTHSYPPSNHYKQNIDWNYTYSYYGITRKVFDRGEQGSYPPPGSTGGWATFFFFLSRRIKRYMQKRYDPNMNVLTNLSPYLNFGSISRQRVLSVMKGSRIYQHKVPEVSKLFIKKIFVYPEVADTYCYFQPHYDKISGGTLWGQDTLGEHRNDPRPHIYTLEELENYQTSDDLWNACQKVLVTNGKLHTLLRPFWAKKLIMWTRTPEEAYNTCLYLNNKYSVDGNDPQSYFGCRSALTSDYRKSKETPIYGHVKCPDAKSLMHLFDVPYFIGKVLGEEAYNRSLKIYFSKPMGHARQYTIMLKNKKHGRGESYFLDSYSDGNITYSQAKEWERISREKHEMRKRRRANATTFNPNM